MNSLLGLCCDSNTSHYIRSRVRDPDPNPLDLSSARNFVLHMNALAHRLGMHRTYFPNPDGPPTKIGNKAVQWQQTLFVGLYYTYQKPSSASMPGRPFSLFKSSEGIRHILSISKIPTDFLVTNA